MDIKSIKDAFSMEKVKVNSLEVPSWAVDGEKLGTRIVDTRGQLLVSQTLCNVPNVYTFGNLVMTTGVNYSNAPKDSSNIRILGWDNAPKEYFIDTETYLEHNNMGTKPTLPLYLLEHIAKGKKLCKTSNEYLIGIVLFRGDINSQITQTIVHADILRSYVDNSYKEKEAITNYLHNSHYIYTILCQKEDFKIKVHKYTDTNNVWYYSIHNQNIQVLGAVKPVYATLKV